jgi:hypothetical protein
MFLRKLQWGHDVTPKMIGLFTRRCSSKKTANGVSAAAVLLKVHCHEL